MKQLTQTQLALLQILGDGACHSGNELGHILGMTRSAIWKQINHLINLEIPITRLPQQGYQLQNQLILINGEEIAKYLIINGFKSQYQLHLFTSIDSTNRYLKDIPKSKTVDLCCSEQQTQGRGRFGRHWHSPFGENIYCSSRWNLNCDLNKLSGLSLVTSLAVLSTIKEFSPSSDIKVKWPNDILWEDKKLCGSLIEIVAESYGNAEVIIGIGLNVNTDTINQLFEEKPWCSLYEITKKRFNRNIIIANLMTQLETYLNSFLINGLNAFIEEWNNSDYLFGKHVTVTQSLNTFSGIASGINDVGQLILQDEKGVTHFLSSGDTTLNNSKGLN